MPINNVFRFMANGKKMRANLVEHNARPKAHEIRCYACKRCIWENMLARVVQYGFVADLYWDMYNCALCGENTAHHYEIVLTERQMVERFPSQ